MAEQNVESEFDNVDVLKAFASRDGKKKLFIRRVSGGFFCYSEERELYQPPASVSDYYYWAETSRSGLYATPDEVASAARRALCWPRDGN